jgi:putative endonuclease
MKYVYILESISYPGNRYIGVTNNLKKRLKEHNSGKSSHTAKFKPWRIILAIYSVNDKKAEDFERYLKSGSGHAFIKRHFS